MSDTNEVYSQAYDELETVPCVMVHMLQNPEGMQYSYDTMQLATDDELDVGTFIRINVVNGGVQVIAQLPTLAIHDDQELEIRTEDGNVTTIVLEDAHRVLNAPHLYYIRVTISDEEILNLLLARLAFAARVATADVIEPEDEDVDE